MMSSLSPDGLSSLRYPDLAEAHVQGRFALNFQATTLGQALTRAAGKISPVWKMQSSIWHANASPTTRVTFCQSSAKNDISVESKNEIGADTSSPPSTTRSGCVFRAQLSPEVEMSGPGVRFQWSGQVPETVFAY